METVDSIIPVVTAKEDRDYLLEYKSINLRRLRRARLLDILVDNVSRDEAVAVILDLIEKKSGPHHILFIDPLKLMKMRPGCRHHKYADKARLVLADGAGIGWAAAKLGESLKERIPMISLLMDVVRLAEKKEMTIYLLGSRVEFLDRVFFNLQRSFPGIRIIGRQGGNFDEQREKMIKESLRKSSPDIILLGMGYPRQEEWIFQNRDSLSRAVVFGVDEAFNILCGRDKPAPDWFQIRGLTWLWEMMKSPWNLANHWRLFKFIMLTQFRSLKTKKKTGA